MSGDIFFKAGENVTEVKGALAIRRIFSLVDMIKKPKEHLAIRRTFSLVDMITNTKFSNCPNVFEIGVVWQ